MRLATYRDRDLEHLCMREGDTVRETMNKMSKAGLRVAPVISTEGKFLGIAADGDIRRYIASTGDPSDPIRAAMNASPILIDAEMDRAEIRSFMMRHGVDSLPSVRDGLLYELHVLWAIASPQELTAVIMAGGLGSRLAPLTDDCPKPLLAIGGKPILTHIIEHLRASGINRFVISVNYLSDMIVNHFGDGTELNVSIDYVHETKRMGTGGALGLIDPSILSDPFIVLNGDVLNNVDFGALRDRHLEKGWDATMIVRNHHYTVPYGVVKTDDEGGFLGAEEKPQLAFHINAGIYMLSKSVLSVVPRDVFYDLPTLFQDLRARGMQAGTLPHDGRWLDIGSIVEFNRAKTIYGEPST